jgi:electron transfer flavoprotein beta subunit
VAYQIAAYAKDKNFDMILTGRESIDYNSAQVAAMLGEFLDLPSISIIKKLDLNGNKATLSREIEGGKEIVEVEGPFVASCAEGVAEWKIPNMRGIMSARTKPLEVLGAQSLEALSMVEKFETPTPRGAVKMVDAANMAQLVDLLHNEAKVI